MAALFAVRDVKRRWPFALRAAVAVAAPVLAGWSLGDTPAGLMAAIGGFTSLYGSGRPYLHRARLLGTIAIAFAAAVTLGIWAASVPVLGVVSIAVIAMLAALLCNALQVGPPGGYMFALACAAGTVLHQEHVHPLHAGLLVLGGGALSWALHLVGALASPRRPEREAVEDSGLAVAAYLDAIGGPEQDRARHLASTALHEAWAALVTEQPRRPRPNGTLSTLRALNRDLHILFAQGLEAAGRRERPEADASAVARLMAARTHEPRLGGSWLPEAQVPLGHPSARQLLAQAVSPGSPHLQTALRVGAAALIAGSIAGWLGIERAYWAIAAAVLVLHQGSDWLRTVQKGLERVVGTGLGLLVALAVLSPHPEGLCLVLAVAVLQFAIEMSVVRNYALAVAFITPTALAISTGGRPVADLGGMLLARGVDTVIGCAVAFAVYAATSRWSSAARLPETIAEVLESVRGLLPHVASGAVASPEAKAARRDAVRQAIAVAQSYDTAVGASRRQRQNAEALWPAVVASERVTYRTLSACWAFEELGDRDAARAAADGMFGADGLGRLDRALSALADAARAGGPGRQVGGLPAFLHDEVGAFASSLVERGP